MRIKSTIVVGVATLMSASAAGAQQRFASGLINDQPSVDVWMSYPEYRPFEKAEIGFRGSAGSYLLVMRIADDGYYVRGSNTVEILYPRTTPSQQPLSGDADEELNAEFKVRGGPGTTGAVFAVSSSRPFDLSKVPQRFLWEQRELPGVLFDHRGYRQDVASRVLEKLGIAPADILGVAVDAYDVVESHGRIATGPRRSHNDMSTDLFRRCEAGSKDLWCKSWPNR